MDIWEEETIVWVTTKAYPYVKGVTFVRIPVSLPLPAWGKKGGETCSEFTQQ